MGNSKKKERYRLIFRRYRVTRDGQVLDARDYGYKAWPIRIYYWSGLSVGVSNSHIINNLLIK